MKKRTILSITIITSLLFVLSCDDVTGLIPDDSKVIGLEKDTVSLSWQEQSLKINVKTLTDFTVSSDCDWISVTKQYSDENSFIEGCLIGLDSEIGKNCTLKNCIIGDNVIIADNSKISDCVIGDNYNFKNENKKEVSEEIFY